MSWFKKEVLSFDLIEQMAMDEQFKAFDVEDEEEEQKLIALRPGEVNVPTDRPADIPS